MKKHQKITVILTAALLIVQNGSLSFPAYAADSNREQTLQETYLQWKDTYITEDTYIQADTPQYYVSYNDERYAGDNISVPVTVSEAHGYGMLITVCMADYDSEAKAIFDGMYRYYRAHLSDIGPNLMSWQQCDNGTALIDGAVDGAMQGGEADSATDGDLDIAYSLLLADQKWGSDGDINYRETAFAVIDDIMEYEVNQTDWLLQLGDWVYWSEPGETYYHATRSSDFILQYFPVFADVTGDTRWNQLYDGTCAVIASITEDQQTGLLPDFIIKDENGQWIPAPAHFLEDVTDGQYAYNSCRTPWRLGVDHLYHEKNETVGTVLNKLNQWIQNTTNGDPDQIMAGYMLDGTATQDYNDLCFVAPFLVAAACDQESSAWEETLWDYIRNYGEDVYYGDTIRLLCMISVTDHWLVPETDKEGQKGDIDGSGTTNLTDLILLHRYLLRQDTLTLEQWERADYNLDNIVNVTDSILLRRFLLS